MAGFNVYYGNRLQDLALECAGLLKKPAGDPFTGELIVVQSRDMERWLSLQLSSRLGVSMHVDFRYPNQFLDMLFTSLLGSRYNPRHFSIPVLTWKIMSILPGLTGSGNGVFRAIGHYLDDRHAGELKLYQLSREIARLFDQYAIYRPGLVGRWETEGTVSHDPDEAWQLALWNELFSRLPPGAIRHRAHVKELFTSRETGAALEGIPPRIVVFSPSVLPFYHVDVLKSLSNDRDVSVFYFTPSPGEAGPSLSAGGLPGRESTVQGNSLLESMGTAGRHCLRKLISSADRAIPVFSPVEGSSLLRGIQRDIYAMTGEHGSSGRSPVDRDDCSLQVHSCHSPLREVEVLLDYLKHLFARRPDIQPHEVLVMTTDIEVYAPYIRSVFSREKLFAFSIADVKALSSSPVFSAFFEILELAGRRFEASRVLRLLEKDIILKNSGIAEGEIPVIHKWVTETNIRWGIDRAHRRRLKFLDYKENSWASGLARMLLGYAMKEEGNASFHDSLPYGEIEGSGALLLGRLKEFLDRLSACVLDLMTPRSLAEWSALLLVMTETFLKDCAPHEYEYRVLRKAIQELGHGKNSLAQLSGFQGAVSLRVVQQHLSGALDAVSYSSGYMRGGITFSGFLPLRCIPFKAICLLGMNVADFPRKETSPAFDLLARDPAGGDRSAREGDRYLFLETLVSAGEFLYMSHAGQDIKDNSEIPPSVLVSEMTEYVGDSVRICFSHRLHPFSPAYFQTPPGRLYSYSEPDCLAARSLQAGQKPESGKVPLLPGTEDKGTVTIAELTGFFRNPARFFLRKRLGIHTAFECEPEPDRESFSLSAQKERNVADLYISASLDSGDDEKCYEWLRLNDALPPLVLGACECEALRDETVPFINRVRSVYRDAGKLEPVDVKVTVGGFTIEGNLERVSSIGLVRHYYRQLGAGYLLPLWIEHLFLCLQGSGEAGKRSVAVGKGKEKKPASFYRLREVADPAVILAELLEVYEEGTRRPIPFFPRTSFAFAEKSISTGNEMKAILEASKIWGPGYDYSERDDNAIALLFGENPPLEEPLFSEFRDHALRVYAPVIAHLEVEK